MATRRSFRWASLVACVAALCSAKAPAAEWGDLRGRFLYDGKPPALKFVTPDKDVEVAPKAIPDERLLVHRENRGIANVVIFIRSTKENPPPVHPSYEATAKGEVTWKIRGCRFEPHIIVVQPRQLIRFDNEDVIAYNPWAVSLSGEGISQLIPPKGSIHHAVSSGQPVPVLIGCTIHPWMKGHIVVNDSPYVAVTDQDGRFTIKNLPAGEWTFQTWHESAANRKIEDVAKFGPKGKPAKWDRGRFTATIRPGDNDLGDIHLAPIVFEEWR